jgi:sulfide dehydrogenase cytochrome subunit
LVQPGSHSVGLPLEDIDMIRNVSEFLPPLCLAIALNAAGTGNVSASDVLQLVEPCAGCHGKDGASIESDIPIIGGYSATYIMDTMVAFTEQERPCEETAIRAGPRKGERTDMCTIAKRLSETEIKLIAEYFAGKPFVRAQQEFDPDKAQQGKKLQEANCKKCHEEGGSSPDDDAGILAGQWIPYIRQQFADYTSGARPMTKKMKPKFEKLSETEKQNLIHYFASFQ